MIHNKWYNPRRSKHDIIVASIIGGAHLFCFIIYLLLPSEMSELRGGGEDAKNVHIVCALFFWVIGKLFEDSSMCVFVCVFPEVWVKKVWARVSEWREWRDWRGNHLRRSRERWGRRRWKSEVLITSFKAPPKKGEKYPGRHTQPHTRYI